MSGAQEENLLGNISPTKRTAMALEGSPMFTPLEVKFKNMKEFQESAKKNMSGRKFVKIDEAIGSPSRTIPDGLEEEK